MKEITGNNEHERYVFVADEVIFQVIHPTFIDDESAARIRGNIVSAINSFIRQEENPWGNSLDLLDEGNAIILTLSSLTQIEESEETSERFSLIPIKISKHEKNDTNQIDVLNLLNDAYTGLEGRFINPEGEAGDRFLRIRLDENFEDIYLKSISANWLASGLHHGGNTGGPGSMPGRKPAPSKPEKKFKFELDGDNPLESLSEYRRPGAQVAILDTARSLNEFNIFPDIKEMFAPMQVFRCDPLLIVMDEYTKLPHHYEMADHGTFIASIIRAITK